MRSFAPGSHFTVCACSAISTPPEPTLICLAATARQCCSAAPYPAVAEYPARCPAECSVEYCVPRAVPGRSTLLCTQLSARRGVQLNTPRRRLCVCVLRAGPAGDIDAERLTDSFGQVRKASFETLPKILVLPFGPPPSRSPSLSAARLLRGFMGGFPGCAQRVVLGYCVYTNQCFSGERNSTICTGSDGFRDHARAKFTQKNTEEPGGR